MMLVILPQGALAGIMRREGESWGNLLVRLEAAIMQSVVENRVISDMHLWGVNQLLNSRFDL